MDLLLTYMSIDINNIVWKIKFIPGSNMNLRRDDGTVTIGMTDLNQKTIFINKYLEDELLYLVLCHELVHAYCFSYDIYMDSEDEEHLANFIANYGREIVNHAELIL